MKREIKHKCNACGGDGFEVGHAPECCGWLTGDCDCSGCQYQCEKCKGQGYLLTAAEE